MLTLYDYLPSQNAYKVRLLLSHLSQPYQTKMVSIFEGEGVSQEYQKINPSGAVPAVQFDDGRTLAESNAILFYLADGSIYLPKDQFHRAKVIQWLSFESDYVQSTLATLRHWKMTGKVKNYSKELVEMKHTGSMKMLSVLDRELGINDYLVGEMYTISDMSIFSYVHLANEAGIALSGFTNILSWINKIKAQPRFLNKVYPYSIDPNSVKELP